MNKVPQVWGLYRVLTSGRSDDQILAALDKLVVDDELKVEIIGLMGLDKKGTMEKLKEVCGIPVSQQINVTELDTGVKPKKKGRR